MSGIILPLDPLLQRAVAIPDTEMDAPPDDTQTGNSGTNDFTPGADDPDEMRSLTHTPHPNPLHTNHSPLTSLTQYAAGIVTSKKLSASSDQELHQFATASEAEREMMTYGICAEIRDGINAIVSRMGAATIHPDLMKCIKSRSAAGFFSPEIGSYTAPAGAKRAKDLQNSIFDSLAASQTLHLPVDGDHVLKEKVLQAIGRELIHHRSTVKEELGKRKPGDPKVDIASFSTRVTRNTTVKVTREHYGRIAFLSREYRTWSGRESIPGISDEAVKLGYWEWVDAALKNVRSQAAESPRGKNEALRVYFEGVITSDEQTFSKAAHKAKDPRTREKWQTDVEAAVGRLTES